MDDDMIRALASTIIDGLTTDGAHHKQWYLENALKLLAPEEFKECKESWDWEKGIPS